MAKIHLDFVGCHCHVQAYKFYQGGTKKKLFENGNENFHIKLTSNISICQILVQLPANCFVRICLLFLHIPLLKCHVCIFKLFQLIPLSVYIFIDVPFGRKFNPVFQFFLCDLAIIVLVNPVNNFSTGKRKNTILP